MPWARIAIASLCVAGFSVADAGIARAETESEVRAQDQGDEVAPAAATICRYRITVLHTLLLDNDNFGRNVSPGEEFNAYRDATRNAYGRTWRELTNRWEWIDVSKAQQVGSCWQ